MKSQYSGTLPGASLAQMYISSTSRGWVNTPFSFNQAKSALSSSTLRATESAKASMSNFWSMGMDSSGFTRYTMFRRPI